MTDRIEGRVAPVADVGLAFAGEQFRTNDVVLPDAHTGINANVPEHRRHRFGDRAGRVNRVNHKSQRLAAFHQDAARIRRPADFLQRGKGFGFVIRVGFQRRIGKVVRRHQRPGERLGQSIVDFFDDQILVHGHVERLAHFRIVERRLLDVHFHPDGTRAGDRLDLNAGHFLQRSDQLGGHFGDNVHLACEQRRDARRILWNHAEDGSAHARFADGFEIGRAAVIVLKAFEHDFFQPGFRRNEFEGTGS